MISKTKQLLIFLLLSISAPNEVFASPSYSTPFDFIIILFEVGLFSSILFYIFYSFREKSKKTLILLSLVISVTQLIIMYAAAGEPATGLTVLTIGFVSVAALFIYSKRNEGLFFRKVIPYTLLTLVLILLETFATFLYFEFQPVIAKATDCNVVLPSPRIYGSKDECLYRIAITTKDPQYCSRMSGEKLKYGTSNTDQTCYFNLAKELDDPSLCNELINSTYCYCLLDMDKSLPNDKKSELSQKCANTYNN